METQRIGTEADVKNINSPKFWFFYAAKPGTQIDEIVDIRMTKDRLGDPAIDFITKRGSHCGNSLACCKMVVIDDKLILMDTGACEEDLQRIPSELKKFLESN